MTSASLIAVSNDPSQLRLWRPDSSDDSRAPHEITLREAFVEHLLPDLKGGREQSSIDQYWFTLRAWERHTTNPPIGKISDMSLKAFRDVRSEDGCRNATVDKNLRNIRTILRQVGPRGDGNPGGKCLIQVVPYCPPLGDDDEPRKRIVRRKEATLLYRACEVATWPAQSKTGISPVALWRRWLVCLWNWGADPGDLKRLTSASIARGDGSPRKALKKRYYVSFVRHKTRRKKKQPLVLPLHRIVERHLLSHLPPAPSAGRPLFPFPRNGRDMKAQWEKILAEAGIPLVLRDAEGHVLKDEAGQEIDNKIYFHDFRKTCNSALDEVSPGIGESVLGHASQAGPQRSRVNKKHYLLIAARRIRKAIDKLQQPKGFGRLEEQRRLF